MKSLIPVIFGAAIASVAMTHSGTVRAENLYNLMMIGSELEVCSSLQSDRCMSTSWIKANDMRTTRLFQLSDVRRKEATRSSIWPQQREEIRAQLATALEELATYFGRGVVSEHRFVERLRSRAYQTLLMQLSEAEYQRLLDNLELRHTDGVQEVANLAQSPATTRDMVEEFVAMLKPLAQTKKPRITLVTAAARNSYDPIERYTGIFEQAGAEVTWLPVDAVVARAQAEGKCTELESLRRDMQGNYDRDRVNPARHEQQLKYCTSDTAWEDMLGRSHGVFFVDGRADNLRDAFIVDQEPTRLMRVMLGRYMQGSLIIGAEGHASAALVTGNMITNGTSREALASGAHARKAPPEMCDLDASCPRDLGPNSVTYEALGGLSIFSFGVVDTNMSQAGRQIRMMRVAQTTGTPLAIGIDGNTALQVNTAQGYFRVIGDEGIFVNEGAQGTDTLLAGTFHYMRHGSSGKISRQGVTDIHLAELPSRRQESLTIRFLDDTGIYDNLGTLCSRGESRLLQDKAELIMQTNDSSTVSNVLGRCQVVNAVLGVALND